MNVKLCVVLYYRKNKDYYSKDEDRYYTIGKVLINRAEHPYVNKLALPGGFYLPTDETLEYASARELLEETGLWMPGSCLRPR